jgi:hypothetical protein
LQWSRLRQLISDFQRIGRSNYLHRSGYRAHTGGRHRNGYFFERRHKSRLSDNHHHRPGYRPSHC